MEGGSGQRQLQKEHQKQRAVLDAIFTVMKFFDTTSANNEEDMEARHLMMTLLGMDSNSSSVAGLWEKMRHVLQNKLWIRRANVTDSVRRKFYGTFC